MKIIYHYTPKIELKNYKTYLISKLKANKLLKILITLVVFFIVLYILSIFNEKKYFIIIDSLLYGLMVFLLSYTFFILIHNFFLFKSFKKKVLKFQKFVFDIHFLEDKFLIKIKDLPDDIVYYSKIKKIERFENSIIIELKESLQYNVISLNNFYINLNKNAFVEGDFYELIKLLNQKHKVTY